MTFTVEHSPEFKRIIRKNRKNAELLKAIDRKIERLEKDPYSVGTILSDELHGIYSTRLIGVFRLLFRIKGEIVELVLIDHRGHVYG